MKGLSCIKIICYLFGSSKYVSAELAMVPPMVPHMGYEKAPKLTDFCLQSF